VNEFDFEKLKNIKIDFPESWVENALEIPSKEHKKPAPIPFYRYAAGIAACVVMGLAVILTMIFGIGKTNVSLTKPDTDYSSGYSVTPDGTIPSGTGGYTAPTDNLPVIFGTDNGTSPAVTEPSEKNENSVSNGNGNSKSKQQSTAPSNGSATHSPQNGKKPNNGSSSRQGATDPDNSEDETAAPATEEPWLPPPWEEPTEEWNPYEPATDEPWLEPPTSLLPEHREREFHFSIYAKLASEDDVVYCKVTDKDGNVVSSGSANLEFYDSVYSLLSYTTCLKASIDDPFKVCFYRADGGVYTTQTIKTRAINNFDLGYYIRAKY